MRDLILHLQHMMENGEVIGWDEINEIIDLKRDLEVERNKHIKIQYENEEYTINQFCKLLKNTESELKHVKCERDKAIADIPHKCWSCANGFFDDSGFNCDQIHYRFNNPDCLSWKWRGAREDKQSETD